MLYPESFFYLALGVKNKLMYENFRICYFDCVSDC